MKTQEKTEKHLTDRKTNIKRPPFADLLYSNPVNFENDYVSKTGEILEEIVQIFHLN